MTPNTKAPAGMTNTTAQAGQDRRDAERYRWIRDNPWPPILEADITLHRNARWDAEIDAAMGATPQPPATAAAPQPAPTAESKDAGALKALEFAECMAKDAEQFLKALNERHAAAEALENSTDDLAQVELLRQQADDRDSAADERWRGLTSAIYEFRKRAAKVITPQPAPAAAAQPERNRATTEPGGCECHECGCIFIGGLEHNVCGVCAAAQPPAAPAEPHWPKLEAPARVGGGTFGIGVSSRLVVEAAQRQHDIEGVQAAMTPEQWQEQERTRRELWDLMHGSPDPHNGAAAVEALRHSANEWADMAINGIQWLRNICEGVSTPQEALQNMEECLKHCREVNDAPEVQALVRGAASQPAPEPAATAAEPDVMTFDQWFRLSVECGSAREQDRALTQVAWEFATKAATASQPDVVEAQAKLIDDAAAAWVERQGKGGGEDGGWMEAAFVEGAEWAAAQQQAVPAGWHEAYAAFQGAFDTPLARRRQDDEFAADARRRLRDFNEAMLAAAPAAQPAEPTHEQATQAGQQT